MNITVDELKELVSLLNSSRDYEIEKIEPENNSVTLRVATIGDGDYFPPFYVGGQIICDLGVYEIHGVKYWICKR